MKQVLAATLGVVALSCDMPVTDQAINEVNEMIVVELPPVLIEVPVEVSRATPKTLSASLALPPPSRDQIWDLARLPQVEAEATALLRISASEHAFANELDTIGIWQVARNVRARHCDNTRLPSQARRVITQCRSLATGETVAALPRGAVEHAEETYLSALRRLSGRAIGALPALSRRHRWIGTLRMDCQRPENWGNPRTWSRLKSRCERIAQLSRNLVDGRSGRFLSRARVIAWGGRCERHCSDVSDPSTCRQSGACDDAFACRRGLARISETATANAFWCRPGEPHCAQSIDPLCEQFGITVGSSGNGGSNDKLPTTPEGVLGGDARS